jgi:uncharacterized membrane protein
MQALFERLDTTPGQEKTILQGFDKIYAQVEEAREQLLSARTELAAVLGGDVFDQAMLDGILKRQSELTEKFTQSMRELVTTVHASLEPDQRRALAELIGDGSAFFGMRGPGRWSRGRE